MAADLQSFNLLYQTAANLEGLRKDILVNANAIKTLEVEQANAAQYLRRIGWQDAIAADTVGALPSLTAALTAMGTDYQTAVSTPLEELRAVATAIQTGLAAPGVVDSATPSQTLSLAQGAILSPTPTTADVILSAVASLTPTAFVFSNDVFGPMIATLTTNLTNLAQPVATLGPASPANPIPAVT